MNIEQPNIICPKCNGKGAIRNSESEQFDSITFVIPKEALVLIKQEINRITMIAGINTKHPALNRGLALEYICQLSAQTPLESLI